MAEKLQQMQQKSEESKQRLNNIFVDAEAGNGLIKVTFTGNKELKNIQISDSLCNSESKEELEELVLTAINRGLKESEKVFEAEMSGVAMGMLKGGMF